LVIEGRKVFPQRSQSSVLGHAPNSLSDAKISKDILRYDTGRNQSMKSEKRKSRIYTPPPRTASKGAIRWYWFHELHQRMDIALE